MIRLERLGRMSVAELTLRSRQSASKWLDRLAGLSGAIESKTALEISLENFRVAVADRFFEGAVDGESPDLFARHMPEKVQRVRKAADAACRGRFDLLGYQGLSFGDPFEWHLDPVRARRAPRVHWSRVRPLDAAQVGDSKVTWELGRHQWMVHLALAYRITRDERYADFLTRSLRDFLRTNPPGLGIHWSSSLEVALRLVSWCWILVLLRLSPALSAELFAEMVSGVVAHAQHVERYLSFYFSPNTHLTGEALGLFYAGVLFPELPQAERWRELGADILVEQSARQVLEDGVYFERSTCYQRYTVEIYLHFLILAARNDIEVPRAVKERLQRMLDFLVAVRRPDGSDPSIGDSDGGSLLPFVPPPLGGLADVLGTSASLFVRSDYAWAASGPVPGALWLLGPRGLRTLTDLTVSPPAASPSRVFPEGGYVTMSSGWRADAHQLVFDVGPLGCPVTSGHGHADLLSIQCSAFGEAFLVDPGTYAYTAASDWRDYFRSSFAHSTAIVDGRSQAEPRGPFAWEARPRARLRRWLSTAEYDFADADTDAYHRLTPPVTHRRRVVFVKPRFWVIADDAEGTEVHRVELRFQFAPIEVDVTGGEWVRARSRSGHSLLLRTFGARPPRMELHEGETDPPRGWVSEAYGRKSPAPMIVASTVTSLPARLLTLLLPWTDAEGDPPEVIAVGGDEAGPIGIGVGKEIVLFQPDGVVLRRSE